MERRWFGKFLLGGLVMLGVASGIYFGLIYWFGVHHELAGLLAVLPTGALFVVFAVALFEWSIGG